MAVDKDASIYSVGNPGRPPVTSVLPPSAPDGSQLPQAAAQQQADQYAASQPPVPPPAPTTSPAAFGGLPEPTAAESPAPTSTPTGFRVAATRHGAQQAQDSGTTFRVSQVDNDINDAVTNYPTGADLNWARAHDAISKEVMLKAMQRLADKRASSSPDDQAAMDQAEKEAQTNIYSDAPRYPKATEQNQAWWAAQQQAGQYAGLPTAIGPSTAAQTIGEMPSPQEVTQNLGPARGFDPTFNMVRSGLTAVGASDIQGARDQLQQQLKDKQITQDQFNTSSQNLDHAQSIRDDPRNLGLFGSSEATQQAQNQVQDLIEQAVPGYKQRAVTESVQNIRNVGANVTGFINQQFSAPLQQPTTAQQTGQQVIDPTGKGRNFLLKNPDERSAASDQSHGQVQEQINQITPGKTVQGIVNNVLKAQGVTPQAPEALAKQGLAPRPEVETALSPLIEATANAIMAVTPMPWEEAAMAAYGKIMNIVTGPGARASDITAGFGKWLMNYKKGHFIKGAGALVATGAAVAAKGGQINLGDDAKWLAAEAAVPLLAGGLIWGIGRGGRLGMNVLRASTAETRLAMEKGVALGTGSTLREARVPYVAGSPVVPKQPPLFSTKPIVPEARVPFRAGRGPVTQFLGRTLESGVRGAVRTIPQGMNEDDFNGFLRDVATGGVTNALLSAPSNFYNAIRGSVWDPIYTYRGEKPQAKGGYKLPPGGIQFYGDDPTYGNLDRSMQKSLDRIDPSRAATFAHQQDMVKDYANSRILPDDVVDNIAATLPGAKPIGTSGYVVGDRSDLLAGRKLNLFLKESQFDIAGSHEFGHVHLNILDPGDADTARYLGLHTGDDNLNRVVTRYANRANPGVGNVEFSKLPTNAEITPGNPSFDPAKQKYSQSIGGLTREVATDEIAADNLGAMASGQNSAQWSKKNPGLRRQAAYVLGQLAEKWGLPTTTPDASGPLGINRGVIQAKAFDNYFRKMMRGDYGGALPSPGQAQLSALPGRPLHIPWAVGQTAKVAGALAAQPPVIKQPPPAPGPAAVTGGAGQPLPQPTGPHIELGQPGGGFRAAAIGPQKQPTTGQQQPTTPAQTQAAPVVTQPPAPHIALKPLPVDTPEEKQLPNANEQTQKVTATEFGYIDRNRTLPSGNKGFGDFGSVDLGNKNQDGVSLPPEDIVKQLGPVMHQDENGVWHAERQFAQDVQNHKVMIEVTNPANGRKVMAPLVDIGPQKKTGAGLDVLYKTARDLNFESGRAPLHYRIAGGHTATTSPDTITPQSLSDAAAANVGKLNTTQDAGTNHGELACADAVTRIVRDQLHIALPRTLSTAELYQNLKNDTTGWKEVDPNTPGAIIVSPTQGDRHGHTGIVGKDGKIYSNSSRDGNWGQNYTVDSWTRSFGDLGVHAFVPTEKVARIQPGEEGRVAQEGGGGGGKVKGGPADILMGLGGEETAAGAAGAGAEIPPLWKPSAGAAQGTPGIQPVHWPTAATQETPEENVPRGGGGGYAGGYGGGYGQGGGGGYAGVGETSAGGGYGGGGGGGGFGGGGATVAFMPGAPGGKGRRQAGGIQLEGGEEEGHDTSGVPNPGGDLVRSHLATGNLPEAIKAHAQSLSPNDARVKKQADNLFKGEHFQAGDELHTHILSNVPDHEKQVLSQAQNAIANKTAMHVAYASAPKEGLEPAPTTRSRQVEYGMSSPQARILGQGKAQIAGHSFIPTSIGVSMAKKKGDPHQGYIQGISTNAAANNHHHLNSELAAMGQQSPYPQLDEKFNRDFHGYVSNLNAGHKGTGEGPAEGTEQYPNSFDETHVPHRLKRNEADFINAVINNQAAKAKSAEGLRELAKKGGTLLSEEGETNPIRHAIDMRQAGVREELARHPNNINNPVIQKAAQRLWSQDTLEPTIRSFKAGLIQHVHEKPEDIEEGIRPGHEFKGLTEALQRAHAERLGRPDVPTSVSFMPGMPGKASPAAMLRNRAINNIERDYAEGHAEEPEVHQKLRSIGEDPSRYRLLEKHGLISPHEERPEALTIEEHGQLTSNLRQQWIGGKLSTKEYRSRIAELPLPEKPSAPPRREEAPTPPEEAPTPEEEPVGRRVAFMPGAAGKKLTKPTDWENADEKTRQAYLKKRVAQTIANQSTDPSAIRLKALKNDNGTYKYDPNLNPIFEKTDYDLVNSPLLKKKGLSQIKGADEHEDTLEPEQHGHLNFVERRRLSALRNASAVDTMANKIADSYNSMIGHPDIAAGKGWYSRMRQKLKEHLGDDNEIFAQLLGATSAKTPVRANFIQALDAYEQWKRGDFDRHIQKYLEAHNKMQEGEGALTQHMRDSGILKEGDPDHDTDADALAHWIKHHDILPRQQHGAKYNANSNAVLKVLAGTWLKEVDAPKTPNFAGNLTGRTLEATIDVWAARHLRRLGYEGLTAGKPWRAQGKGEPGVSGLDFGFSQDAMRKAADKIGINPDDLQAILWYGEKHHYHERGWTRGAGAEKSSFDDVFDKVFSRTGEPMKSHEVQAHYAAQSKAEKQLRDRIEKAQEYATHSDPKIRAKLAGYMEKHNLTHEQVHGAAPEEEEGEEEAA